MSDAERAKKHREEASRLRAQAAQMPWHDLREQLERIARQYESLAENLERNQSVDPSDRSN